MNRIAVFSSYSKNHIVDDYVISYLHHLKELIDKIIFIADNIADETQKHKIESLVDYAEFAPHGEYDFGSYKRGFNYAKNQGWLDSCDELVLCNDSCFCISSLKPIFDKMDKKECDFWGMATSNMLCNHLQSYFLVFKQNVFTNTNFADWINKVKKQKNATEVVKAYELTLTKFLQDLGFRPDSHIQPVGEHDPMSKPIDLLNDGVPLIKRKIFTDFKATSQSPRKFLSKLKKINKKSFDEIHSYYKTNFSRIFPLLIPRDKQYLYDKAIKFFFQKKITKSGRILIKICKIPIFSAVAPKPASTTAD